MTIVVTGANGYLGSRIYEGLRRDFDCVGIGGRSINDSQFSCDFTSKIEVVNLASKLLPVDCVINCIGNKDLNFCEKNISRAYEINVGILANILQVFGGVSKIVHISTDYVFDGKNGPYAERDTPCPDTVYGESKLAAEKLLLENSNEGVVARVSAVYDGDSAFINRIRKVYRNRKVLEAYTDALFSPVYITDVVNALKSIITTKVFGSRILHVSGDVISRYEFANDCAEVFFRDSSFVKKARKPENGFLRNNLGLLNQLTCNTIDFASTKRLDALMEISDKYNEIC